MTLLNDVSQGYTTFSEARVLPASHVDYAASAAMRSYVVNSTASPVAQIIFGGTVLGTSIAFFSSRGPSVQSPGILKPDITGPGVNVQAVWPFPVGPPSASGQSGGETFNFLSGGRGTSMSTPHLSGIAASLPGLVTGSNQVGHHDHCRRRRPVWQPHPERATPAG